MWSDGPALSAESSDWHHMARWRTDKISPRNALMLNMEDGGEVYSDTAFACLHNPSKLGCEWGIVRLDGLRKTDDTALLRLFRSNTAIVNFIARRYYHRMLHPLRDVVFTV